MIVFSPLSLKKNDDAIYAECGTKSFTPDEINKIEEAISDHQKQQILPKEELTFQFGIRWHVITDSDGNGNLTDDQILKSIDLLNEGFSGKLTQAGKDCDANEVSGIDMSIQFVLDSVDYTVDDEWFHLYFADEETIDTIGYSLYEGNCSTLNVYSTKIVDESGLDTNVRGLAAPSDTCSFIPTIPRIWEFIFVDYRIVPKSLCHDVQTVDTLIHEAGHWIGLFHPFEGGCAGTDFVEDTPPQVVTNTICPIGSDSCPNEEGLDSIHNYMSYTDVCCQYTFTPGQKARTQSYLFLFRPLGITIPTNETDTTQLDQVEQGTALTCVNTLKMRLLQFECLIERLKHFWGTP